MVKDQILTMGIKKENILDSGICTICNNDYFYSYRISGEGKTGHHAGFIELR